MYGSSSESDKQHPCLVYVCVCVFNAKQVTKTRLDPSWQTVSERAQELVARWAEASQRMVSSSMAEGYCCCSLLCPPRERRGEQPVRWPSAGQSM